MNLDNHPTVIKIRRRNTNETTVRESARLDADLLKRLCLEAGADDVGLVEIDRPELFEERVNIEAVFPHAKTLVSFVCRMNREPIRSPARSIANLEFHQTTDRVNEVAQRIVAALHERGLRAINPAAGFPMEMDRFPDRIWVVSEKTAAVAAGLGQMGIHRNVIHPIFGNFILLGVVITDAEVTEHARPIDFNPCLECKLCVAACPVGAIGDDGHFNFSACFTHNYREFMGGFIDWVDTIAESDGAAAYRRKVPDAETASIWQTLSFGANYKAAYCMAVCPAGEEVISPFLAEELPARRGQTAPGQGRTGLRGAWLRRRSPCAAPIPA
jgi:NAD-dependent dihydropyrimidine dehydrogenase PreA subunit